jgi:hypothetical protein
VYPYVNSICSPPPPHLRRHRHRRHPECPKKTVDSRSNSSDEQTALRLVALLIVDVAVAAAARSVVRFRATILRDDSIELEDEATDDDELLKSACVGSVFKLPPG